jgi:hypothetical protein
LYVEAAVVEELRNRYGKYTSLHRVVADAPSGAEVDHRDGNGLNCVDGNLRIATQNQNAVNRKYDNPSGYRGVRRNPWGSFVVQITYDGKNHHLGSFSSAEEAGLAYNAEESRVFGEFAILNDIPEDVCQL